MGIFDNLIGALEKASETLGTVEDAASVLQGTKGHAAEILDDGLGAVGTVVRAARVLDRGRNMVGRLTDRNREEKPGTIEVMTEAGDFIFGDDPNAR